MDKREYKDFPEIDSALRSNTNESNRFKFFLNSKY